MAKDIESEFRLEKKLVPKEVGDAAGEAGNDAEEVGVEGLDSALGDVATMGI